MVLHWHGQERDSESGSSRIGVGKTPDKYNNNNGLRAFFVFAGGNATIDTHRLDVKRRRNTGG